MVASNNLIGNIAQPVNHVAQAFDARSTQMDQQREKEQAQLLEAERQRDADFHKVVTYAGDGLVEEAKYFAKQKGIDVPEAVFSNGTFAKGLSMAGNIYGDDPEKANIFTQAFMNSQGDLNARFQAGIQVAGKPVSQSDRDFMNFVRKEQWKLKNNPSGGSGFTLAPGATRYDASGKPIATAPGRAEEDEAEKYASKIWQDTYLAAIEGDGLSVASRKTPQEAEQIANEAAAGYRRAFGGGQAPAGGGMQTAPASQISTGLTAVEPMNSKQPILVNEKALQSFIEEARNSGYSDEEITQELESRGVMSGEY